MSLIRLPSQTSAALKSLTVRDTFFGLRLSHPSLLNLKLASRYTSYSIPNSDLSSLISFSGCWPPSALFEESRPDSTELFDYITRCEPRLRCLSIAEINPYHDRALMDLFNSLSTFTSLRILRLQAYAAYLPFQTTVQHLPPSLVYLELVQFMAHLEMETTDEGYFGKSLLHAFAQDKAPVTLKTIRLRAVNVYGTDFEDVREQFFMSEKEWEEIKALGIDLGVAKAGEWDPLEVLEKYGRE